MKAANICKRMQKSDGDQFLKKIYLEPTY